MMQYPNSDLFSFSPTAQDSGDELSDVDTQNEDIETGAEYASSDEPIEENGDRFFEFQTCQKFPNLNLWQNIAPKSYFEKGKNFFDTYRILKRKKT